MTLEMFTESMRKFADEWSAETGFRYELSFERQLSPAFGRIIYHNERMRTVCINLFGMRMNCRKRERLYRDIWLRYAFCYICACIRMEAISLQPVYDSYLQGLASVSLEDKKKKGDVWLKSPRKPWQTYMTKKDPFHPDDLYCDLTALYEVWGELQTEMDLMIDETGRAVKEYLSLINEAEALCSLPEIIYHKSTIPYRLIADGFETYQTVLEKTSDCIRDPFYQELGMRVLAYQFYKGSPDNAVISKVQNWFLQNEEHKAILAWNVSRIRKNSVEYLKGCTDHSSKVIKDNRIAVERMIREINALMRHLGFEAESRNIHPMGY